MDEDGALLLNLGILTIAAKERQTARSARTWREHCGGESSRSSAFREGERAVCSERGSHPSFSQPPELARWRRHWPRGSGGGSAALRIAHTPPRGGERFVQSGYVENPLNRGLRSPPFSSSSSSFSLFSLRVYFILFTSAVFRPLPPFFSFSSLLLFLRHSSPAFRSRFTSFSPFRTPFFLPMYVFSLLFLFLFCFSYSSSPSPFRRK